MALPRPIGENAGMDDQHEAMRSPIEMIWDWSYVIEQTKLEELYAKAKRDQWNADVAIDWSLPVDPGGKILDAERMALPASSSSSSARAKAQRETFNAHYSAWILSQLLHGEQGALMVAGELVAAVPDYEAKLYVASQAMDEARHVEVFRRYIRKLDKIYPAQPTLKSILTDIMETPLLAGEDRRHAGDPRRVGARHVHQRARVDRLRAAAPAARLRHQRRGAPRRVRQPLPDRRKSPRCMPTIAPRSRTSRSR